MIDVGEEGQEGAKTIIVFGNIFLHIKTRVLYNYNNIHEDVEDFLMEIKL